MPALIPELIAMATDPSIKTSALLLKVWVAARQLQQPELYCSNHPENQRAMPGLIPIQFDAPQLA